MGGEGGGGMEAPLTGRRAVETHQRMRGRGCDGGPGGGWIMGAGLPCLDLSIQGGGRASVRPF